MRRAALASLLVLVAVLLGWTAIASAALDQGPSAGAGRGRSWVGTWGASPQAPLATGISSTGFRNQTLRQVLHASIGGPRVRLRLTNAFGTAPLRIDEVRVASSRGAGSTDGSGIGVTFNGVRSVTIPSGAPVISDPVAYRVQPDSELAVSLYVSAATGPATWHQLARQTTYLSAAGNHAADATGKAFPARATSFFFLDGVDVAAPRTVGALVTFGDSITDGYNSTLDASRRYPNDLARRLLALPADAREAVLNEGISGNWVLNDSPCCGVNALARFDRDVLAQDGVRDVIVLEGINDIPSGQLSNPATRSHTDVSASEIIHGLNQLVERAHLHRLRILGGTLLPFQGFPSYSVVAEAKRQAVNEWIRTRSGFDGVVDFDRVMRDPSNPLRLLPAYDSGDHLHPNDAGYAAMAGAVSLRCVSAGSVVTRLSGPRAACTARPRAT